MPPEYSNVPELAFDWVIVTYFFLGGLSAGAFLLSVVANYWKTDLQPLAKKAAILAPIALGVGLLLLLGHLGKPMRFWRMMVAFRTTSVLWWGVWFLNIFMAISLVYAWRMLKGQPDRAKAWGGVGVPLALLVGTYTGVLLNQMVGKALWNTALLPVMFLNGGLVCGVAAVILLSLRSQEPGLLAKAGRILGVLVLVELALAVLELVLLYNHGGEAAAAADALVGGQYWIPFLGIHVVLGTLVPLVILFTSKARVAHAVAAALVLIGIFAMRYVVVIGGQVMQS